MASAFGHAIAAATIGKIFPMKKPGAKFWILGITCSILPDIDVLAFRFGIPYESLFGHRGITHSFFFAAILGGIVLLFFYPEVKALSKKGFGLFLFFALCTASHPMLDAMTTGGLGVAFFAPFDNTRYFLPWQVIQVSPLSVDSFFTEWGLTVLKSEAIWIGLPCLGILVTYFVIRKLFFKPEHQKHPASKS